MASVKEPAVKPALTILLPVHNAEPILAEQVQRLLELVPDLTNQFEIVIVDDGSTDPTEDIARELAHQYPQVVMMRLPKRLGRSVAIKQGMLRARGEIVFTHEQGVFPSPTDLRRMWAMRRDETLIMPGQQKPIRPVNEDLLQRLGMWGTAIQDIALARGEQVRILPETLDAAEELRHAETMRHDHSHGESTPPRRGANFLAYLRKLALGE
jgi:glycosyltransferase involved in cell wall biosynthesis